MSTRIVNITSIQSIPAGHARVLNVLADLENFHARTPLTSFRFQLYSGTLYDYQFVAVDGRTWNQQINVPNAPQDEATMGFSVPGLWKLSEFSLQRPLRDAVIELARQYQLTLFEVVYS